MTYRRIETESARQQVRLPDTPLHLVHSKKRTLGDKLQELARLSPTYLGLIEVAVDRFLEIVKSA